MFTNDFFRKGKEVRNLKKTVKKKVLPLETPAPPLDVPTPPLEGPTLPLEVLWRCPSRSLELKSLRCN